MYKKLTKNFVGKNISLFIFLSIAITLCLFGFLFSDSLSKNFLNQIKNDAQKNLGWDITINIWSADQENIEKQLSELIDKESEQAKQYTIQSSYKIWEDIFPANILFISENFPFYGKFWYKIINPEGKLLISESLYKSISEKQIAIFDNKYQVLWYYSELPSSVGSFLSQENIFIPMEYFWEIIAEKQNIFFEKQYFLKLFDKNKFRDIKNNLDVLAKEQNFRVSDYESGWERFGDIISNIRQYINFAILFALILTCVILFVSLRSFFIQERKNLSILRILWMNNLQFWGYFMSIFALLFIFSTWLAVGWVKLWYYLLQFIPETQSFSFEYSSLLEAGVIIVLLMIIGVWFPLYQFISTAPNSGFSENFFSLFEKKQKFIFWGTFVLGIIIFALILGYTWKIIMIFLGGFSVFLGVFFYITKWLNYSIYWLYLRKKKKNFELFDALRSTIKPGNISFLLQVSFFSVFFIGFFIFLFAGNFSNRLQVNLQSDNNFFVLNIDEDTYQKVDDEYKNNTFSIFRGRIKAINEVPLQEHLWGNSTGRFSREYNITDNSLVNVPIIEGKQLQPRKISLDDNFAQDLWVKIWDNITFQIFGLEKSLEVVNIRQSQDYAINPFFYFQVFPADFEKYPKQYFLSTQVSTKKISNTKQYFYEISWGSVQFIEVEKILVELKEISQKVLGVIQILFVYISVFSILAILVIIWFYKRFSGQKSKLYYLLWSTKRQNKIRQFIEFFSLSFSVFLGWILLSSFAVYLLLEASDFIAFEWNIWGNNFMIFLFVYIIFLCFLYKRIK